MLGELQFSHKSQLHWVFSSKWMLRHFSLHWFNFAVMFGSVSLLSFKLVTLKLSSALDVPLVYQSNFQSCFVLFPNGSKRYTHAQYQRRKKSTFKSIFQKKTGYTTTKLLRKTYISFHKCKKKHIVVLNASLKITLLRWRIKKFDGDKIFLIGSIYIYI